MKKLRELYRKTGWHTVFSYDDEASTARTHLLYATIVQSIVNGFTTGIFYTGFLIGYGINIVNISIITLVPYLASLFTLFTPYILERFPVRRHILSITRILYYAVNILGITALPYVVHDENARVVWLVIIVFVANAIYFTFTSYMPWHVKYLTPETRTGYFSGAALVSNVSGSIFLIIASIITDKLSPEAQQDMIVALRIAAFAMAILDVYFLQKPKEPVYEISSQKPKLLDVFRLPLSNKRFLLTTVLYAMYLYSVNLVSTVVNTWLLQDVQISYLYINLTGAAYAPIILLLSPLWSRFMQKKGTFVALSLGCILSAATWFAHVFVTPGNYIWLLTAVRLGQFMVGVLLTFAANNLIYVNLPKADQTNYFSFQSVLANVAVFLAMVTATWIVAQMGESTVSVFGQVLGSVPFVMLCQTILLTCVSMLSLLLRKKLQPEGRLV